ncbi:MAG: HD domain-containing protein [Gemmatimonadaceae bacterium]|nr:HD domain-containing protein [Gemmatimonadaceae bacterium]
MKATIAWVHAVQNALAAMAHHDERHPARVETELRAYALLQRALASDGPIALSMRDGTMTLANGTSVTLPRWEWGERLAALGVARLEVDARTHLASSTVLALLTELRQRLDAPARLPAPWAREGIRLVPAERISPANGAVPVAAPADASPSATRPTPAFTASIRAPQVTRAGSPTPAVGARAVSGATVQLPAILPASRRASLTPIATPVVATAAAVAAAPLESELRRLAHVFEQAHLHERVALDEARAVAHGVALVVRQANGGRLPRLAARRYEEYAVAHAMNVALLVGATAMKLHFTDEDLQAIATAALLHDIGATRVPHALLAKTTPLTVDELAVVRRHTELGARMLLAEDSHDLLAATVAHEHHLHADGRGGYPVLRVARAPHFASRLVQLADVFDAMCSERPYAAAVAPRAALDTMESAAGTQLDLALYRIFRRVVEDAHAS